tara:strand:+ start:3873 stop:5393 length:1521 start_codon:yes stop_codon:yes gene_type:complete
MDVEKFKNIFSGLDRAYGQYKPGDIKNGKQGGHAYTKRDLVSDALWQNHLEGQTPSLGIVPIRDDSTCSWGCIDIDTYPLDYKAILNKIKKYKLKMTMCRSKSGGAHLFLFLVDPIKAEDLRDKLMEIAAGLGYGNCEIFPKQIALNTQRGDTGSFLNLPYHDANNTMRYAFKEDGSAATLEEFFELYEKNKITKEEFEKIKIQSEQTDMKDGPPCLEILMETGVAEGGRDNVLFQYAVYAKKKWPDEWRDKIGEFNNKYMNKPLSFTQVEKTIKQHTKTDYKFKCKDQPMCSFCNAPECRKREFGIGGNYEHRFSDLKKYQSENSIWYLNVDGNTVVVTTKQLYNQGEFIIACLDQTNIVLNDIPRQEWKRKIQELADNVEVIEMGEDVTMHGRFDEHLFAFVNDQGRAENIDEINYGKAFEEEGNIYFKMEFVITYLEKQKFKGFNPTRVAARLSQLGGKPIRRTVEKKQTRLWEMKSDFFKRRDDELPLPGGDKLQKEEELPF